MTVAGLPGAGWLPLPVGPGAKAFCSVLAPVPGMELPSDIRIVTAGQVHSARVAAVDGRVDEVADTDALITCSRLTGVVVRTADCVPVVVNAPAIGAVAAIHAGWRGSLAGIVAETLAMLADMGADMSGVYAAVGPHICGKCYEVSPELARQFEDSGYGDCVVHDFERPHIDLGRVNVSQLLAAGVPEGNIARSEYCTLCTPGEIFPSYRRNATTERLYTLIYKV